jgi:hypothetical protein
MQPPPTRRRATARAALLCLGDPSVFGLYSSQCPASDRKTTLQHGADARTSQKTYFLDKPLPLIYSLHYYLFFGRHTMNALANNLAHRDSALLMSDAPCLFVNKDKKQNMPRQRLR